MQRMNEESGDAVITSPKRAFAEVVYATLTAYSTDSEEYTRLQEAKSAAAQDRRDGCDEEILIGKLAGSKLVRFWEQKTVLGRTRWVGTVDAAKLKEWEQRFLGDTENG
jgi:hypothetical protein